jgi:hypothetical protein
MGFARQMIGRLTDAVNSTNDLRASSGDLIANRCFVAFQTALLAAYALQSASEGRVGPAADNASSAAYHACMTVEPNFQIVQDIRDDYFSLRTHARFANWNDDSLEPLQFFSTPPDFTDYNRLPDTASTEYNA